MIQPQVTFPSDWVSSAVNRDGTLSVQQAGTSQHSILGQIQLACFINEEGLRETEPGLYEETDASGAAFLTRPGSDGAGVVLQGWLSSNSAWKALLSDEGTRMFMLGAIAIALAWLALEVRRLRLSLPSRDHSGTARLATTDFAQSASSEGSGTAGGSE
jgi:hypothetical protein